MLQDAPTDPGRNEPPTLDQRVSDLQQELREQGDRMRTTQRNFSIFAVLALLLGFAALITVAAKLQSKPESTTTPSATATAAPAQTSTPAQTATPAPTQTQTATATPTAAPLPASITAKLTEMKIALSASTVAAGKVTIKVTNAGSDPHELVVLDTDTPAAKLPTESNGRAVETGNVGETGDMQPGETKTVKLNLKPGHYAVICNLPGHYAAGMYTDMTAK